MNAITLAVLCIIPRGPIPETVELVEVNTCFNEEGNKRFTQVIFWDRDRGAGLHVRQWVMADRIMAMYRRRGVDGVTVIVIVGDRWVVVRARRMKRTETFVDPEEDDRRVVGVENRKVIWR